MDPSAFVWGPVHALIDPVDGAGETEVLSWGSGNGIRAVKKLARRHVIEVACSDNHNIAMTTRGDVFVWGANADGELLSEEPAEVIPAPQRLESGAEGAVRVSIGGHHAALLTASGAPITFGSNEFGALGHSVDRASPFRVPPRAIPRAVLGGGTVHVAQMACGSTHTVLLGRAGEVFTCGSGVRGALGRGEDDQRPDVARVTGGALAGGVPVVHVAAGYDFSTAVTIGGLGVAWGTNRHGQLGLALPSAAPTKAPSQQQQEQQQAAGKASAAAPATPAGDAAAAGSLVTAPPALAFLPARVEIPELLQLSACGDNHTMWLSRSGRLYAAGRNQCGQLGIVDSAAEPAAQEARFPSALSRPALVSTLEQWRVRDVSCGSRHTLVLTADSQVFAMGSCAEGQTGLRLQPPAQQPATQGAGATDGPDGSEAQQDTPMAVAAHTSSGEDRRSCLWLPTRIDALSGIGVFRIAAGGDGSLAVRVTRGRVFSLPTAGTLPFQRVADTVSAVALTCAARSAGTESDAIKRLIQTAFASATHANGSFLSPALTEPFYLFEVAAGPGSAAEAVDGGGGNSGSGATECGDDATAAMADGDESAELASTVSIVPPSTASADDSSADVSSAAESSSAPDDDFVMEVVPQPQDLLTPSVSEPSPPALPQKAPLAQALAMLGCSPDLDVRVALAHPGPLALASEGTTSGVDVTGLESAYTLALSKGGTDAAHALLLSMAKLLDELEPEAPRMAEPDGLRCILSLWLAPTHSLPSASAAHLARLCGLILALPQASRDLLFRWIGEDVPGALFGSRLVRPLLAHTAHHAERMLAGNPGGPVAMSRLPTFAAVPAPSAAGSRSGGAQSRQASQQQQQPPTVGISAAATAVPWTSESGKEGVVTHAAALELLVRVLRLCYNLNERLAEEARTDAEVVPAARRRKRRAQLADADGDAAAAAAHGQHWSVNRAPPGALLPHDAFYSTTLSKLPSELLHVDYERWRQSGFKRMLTTPIIVCHYPFLLDAAAKRRLLAYEAAVQMQAQATQAIVQSMFMGDGVSTVLDLQVRRAYLLHDTLTQISMRPPADLRKKLRVTFVGEDALDAGGVTKELFQLLVKQLLDPVYGLFEYDPETRQHWLSRAALPTGVSDGEFFLAGVVLGLAIYNSTLLDVHFPQVAYKQLLGLPVGLADLRSLAPDVARGLERLLAYDGPDVEDVFCLTFTASYEAFGEVRTVELVPGGASRAVTAENRAEYVRAYVEWRLTRSVAGPLAELLRGFRLVAGGPALGLFRPEELELLVAGTPHLDFSALEAVATYEGGFSKEHPCVRAFWRVVHALSDEDKRRLLLFVTGCAKAPIGGLGALPFKVQRNGGDSERLPTASTCFNILLLPEYATEEKLRDRLRTAIAECAGFGLQ